MLMTLNFVRFNMFVPMAGNQTAAGGQLQDQGVVQMQGDVFRQQNQKSWARKVKTAEPYTPAPMVAQHNAGDEVQQRFRVQHGVIMLQPYIQGTHDHHGAHTHNNHVDSIMASVKPEFPPEENRATIRSVPRLILPSDPALLRSSRR